MATKQAEGGGNNGFTTGVTAVMPAAAAVGNLAMLVVTWSSPAGETLTAPAGWTPITATGVTSGSIRNGHTSMGIFFGIVASSGALAAGGSSSMTLSAQTNARWDIVVLAGAASTVAAALDGIAVALETVAQATHTTPMATMSQAVTVLQVVGDRSGTTTSLWTPSAGETLLRAGYYSAATFGPTHMVSAKDVGAGSRGGNVETANQSDAAAIMWTIGIAPPTAAASAQTVYPVADTNVDASIVQVGGTPGSLYTAVDEVTLDTADLLEFTDPDGTKYYGCRLGAVTLPLSSLRIECVVQTPNASTASRKVQIRSANATSLIAERTFNGVVLPPNWGTDVMDLTPSEIAAITASDVNDLRFRFYPTAA